MFILVTPGNELCGGFNPRLTQSGIEKITNSFKRLPKYKAITLSAGFGTASQEIVRIVKNRFKKIEIFYSLVLSITYQTNDGKIFVSPSVSAPIDEIMPLEMNYNFDDIFYGQDEGAIFIISQKILEDIFKITNSEAGIYIVHDNGDIIQI
jgi:hypothetical protein